MSPPETSDNGSFSVSEIARVEQTIVRETNARREKFGLQPLERNSSLDVVSDYYAWKMWDENFYSHKSPQGNEHHDRLAMYGISCLNLSSENLNHGPLFERETPTKLGENLVDEWMDSPEHREAIMTSKYSYIGVGVFVNDSEVWAVQLFCERIEIEEGSIADRRGKEGQERIPYRQHTVSLFQVQPKLEPTSQ